MKKKVLVIIGATAVVITLGFGSVGIARNYYTSSSSDVKERELYQMAKKEKDRLDQKGTYDPKAPIDKDQIKKKAENVAEMYDMSVKDAEKTITKNAIEKKALYLAAEDAGITVTDQEVTEEIEKIKATFVSDPEGQKELKAQIAGMGLEEDEYWESLRPQYKSNMIANKYLRQNYEKKGKEEGIEINSEEFQEKKKAWRDEIIQDAIEKYQVEE